MKIKGVNKGPSCGFLFAHVGRLLVYTVWLWGHNPKPYKTRVPGNQLDRPTSVHSLHVRWFVRSWTQRPTGHQDGALGLGAAGTSHGHTAGTTFHPHHPLGEGEPHALKPPRTG